MTVKSSRQALSITACDFAVGLAREAMQILREGSQREVGDIQTKAAGDVSTELDRKIETFFRRRLHERFPEHAFLGEEGGGSWPVNHAVWIVDPIDGSLNFVHGYPQYSISLALVIDGKPVAACVADPCRDEIFSAAKGHGAQLNGQLIKVSETTALIEALAATVFPKPTATFMADYLDQLGLVMRQVGGVRRSGSMALEMAYLAAGRCDVFWERAMGPWDAAAGLLLIEEAGGMVFSLDVQPILLSDHIAAATPRLAETWRTLLTK
jgi:myo-inositol-1(or 4)-monophosphatase